MGRLLSNLDRLKELRKKNARLREALKFYAEVDNYSHTDVSCPEILADGGRKAKSALEETK